MKEAEAICEQITGNSKGDHIFRCQVLMTYISIKMYLDFIVLIGNINRKLKLVQLKIKIAKVPIEVRTCGRTRLCIKRA